MLTNSSQAHVMIQPTSTDECATKWFHLTVTPADLIIFCRDDKLFFTDKMELPPTRSAVLQLVCLANENQVSHTYLAASNTLIINKADLKAFLATIAPPYQALADMLRKQYQPNHLTIVKAATTPTAGL
jgi:hypothetical protein